MSFVNTFLCVEGKVMGMMQLCALKLGLVRREEQEKCLSAGDRIGLELFVNRRCNSQR